MRNYLKYISCVAISVAFIACQNNTSESQKESGEEKEEVQENRVYGILADNYSIQQDVIQPNEFMGSILGRLGVSASQVDKLDKVSKDVFPLNKIRSGKSYTTFMKSDSLSSTLDYFVYEIDNTDYVVFAFEKDSVYAYKGVKPITVNRVKKSASIESSMWGAIMDADLPYALAAEIEDIYQWTVDFFAIKKGDKFTVIYEEQFVQDTISVGIGRIWGAKFTHGEEEYYAIPFVQDSTLQYWEADGGSLRKQMLKAPLKYSRVSSGFTYARLHPIYKVYRPHTGVDYAAPSGTPVHSVADGVVVFKGWAGGGGNTLKIKHPGNITTGYMHLRGYAKGINSGTHVKQGQLIGYVGSTGASTGPHLDYRVWKGSTPINPMKIPQKPAVPISEKNREAFEYVKKHIMAELNNEKVNKEDIITDLDSLVIPRVDSLKVK